MKQTRNFAEFWSSLFAEAQVTYLTFILLTLQTLTKLKTTFGRNLFIILDALILPERTKTRSGYFSKVI
jgi:hypothetical protein